MRPAARSNALRLVVLLVVIGATGAVSGPPAAATGGGPAPDSATLTPAAGPDASTSTTETIDLTTELRLTPRVPGEIAVQLRYAIPESVVALDARLPAAASEVEAEGFVRQNDTIYAWDEQTSDPTITYRLPVNESLDTEGPIAGQGNHIFVDRGSWALIRLPQTGASWSWRGGSTVGLERETTTAGPGAVGGSMAFLGDYREVVRTTNDQTFRLIVPDAARLEETPSRILDAMAAASGTLRVGDRDDEVFAVAAPTTATAWAVRGLQTGDADFWVRDAEQLDTVNNVWVHEYVHTRQGYRASEAVQWFTEASASYYGALLALQQARIEFDAFVTRLAAGTRTPDRSAVLSDPGTWQTAAQYTKGALVAGALDRQLRLATNRTRSLQAVFSRMNAHGAPVSRAVFQEMIGAVGGETPRQFADRYTTTEAVPSTWNRTAHARAFDATPALISYRLPDPTDSAGYRVSGPYRNGTLGSDRPIGLGVGETLRIEGNVSNDGGAAGEYDVRLLVDGVSSSRAQGVLDPGESRTVAHSHTFSRPGEYVVNVGGEEVPVTVREPVTPTVDRLDVSATGGSADGEQRVEIVAAIRNPDPTFPAAANLTLSRNGELLETRPVAFAPAEEQTYEFTDSVGDPGEYVYRLGGRTGTVTISIPTSTPDPTPTTTSSATPPDPTPSTASPRLRTASETPTGTAGGLGPFVAVLALFVLAGRRVRRQ